MNRIDYELGLVSSEEDFQNAMGDKCYEKCTEVEFETKQAKADCFNSCRAKVKLRRRNNSMGILGFLKGVRPAKANPSIEAEPQIERPLGIATIRPTEIAAIDENYSKAQEMPTAENENAEGKKLSTGGKIGIGVGVIAIILFGMSILKK